MNSKEALEKLYNISCVQPGPVKEQFITYEKEIKHNRTTGDLYDIIKQDLERLEMLEKQNKLLNETKNCVDKVIEDLGKINEENTKLKKAIEILKDKLKLHHIKHSKLYTMWCIGTSTKLSKQEYNLLEEVLENETNN